jgi:hypothetical protein
MELSSYDWVYGLIDADADGDVRRAEWHVG